MTQEAEHKWRCHIPIRQGKEEHNVQQHFYLTGEKTAFGRRATMADLMNVASREILNEALETYSIGAIRIGISTSDTVCLLLTNNYIL